MMVYQNDRHIPVGEGMTTVLAPLNREKIEPLRCVY
jgi:hypothetical protein